MAITRKHALIGASILLALSFGSGAGSEGSCRQYPLAAGTAIIKQTPSGPSLAATGHASVNFDDLAAYHDARAEAELNAKAMLGNALKQGAPAWSGENGWKERLETLLRGVRVLSSCYTPREEVRVTVAVSPESIVQAEELAEMISRSLARQPAPVPHPGLP